MVPLSPGVYVRETDKSEVIPGVATSVAAIVGYSKKGEVDKPVLINSISKFIDEFGVPSIDNPFHYSSIAFLSKGSQLWALRVVNGATYGGCEIVDSLSTGSNFAWSSGKVSPKTSYTFSADGLFTIFGKNPGSWNNDISVKVVYSDRVSGEVVGVGNGSNKSFSGDLLNKPIIKKTLYITYRFGSTDYVIRDKDGDGKLYEGSVEVGSINYDTGVYSFTCENAPSDGTKLYASYAPSFSDRRFDIYVYKKNEDGGWDEVERFLNCSRKRELDGFGVQKYVCDRVNLSSKYIYVRDNESAPLDKYMKEQTSYLVFNGGGDGSAVTASQVNAGWDKFSNSEDYPINILIGGGSLPGSVEVSNKMIQLVESRKDCIAILDIPKNLVNPIDIVDYRKRVLMANTSYAALYAHWRKIYDQWNDTTIDVPASGFVAAQIAYTDEVANVAYAPAGLSRGRVVDLGPVVNFSKEDMDVLYPSQVNPIPSFAGEGSVIWGDRTLQSKMTALSFLPIRRTFLLIEGVLKVFFRQYLFEINDEGTRLLITTRLGRFLSNLVSNNMITDFYVVCDERNNPPEVVEKGELHVTVCVKPVYPIEFIMVNTVVTGLSVSFEEVLG